MFHEDWVQITRFYYSLGFNILPTYEKRPVGDWQQWQSVRQTGANMERLKWHEATGIAAVCGEISGGLICFDLDKQEDDTLLMELLERLELPLTYEWSVRTGSQQGYHVWVTSALIDLGGVGHRQLPSVRGGNLDLRYNNHYALLPPSNHPSGHRYEFLNSPPATAPTFVTSYQAMMAFQSLTIAPQSATEPTNDTSYQLAPENSGEGWNDDYDQVYIQKALEAAAHEVATQSEGNRNETLYRQTLKVAGFVGKGGFSERDIVKTMVEAAVQTGLNPDEVQRTVVSAFKVANPREIPPQRNTKTNGNGHTQQTNDSQAWGGTPGRNLTDYGNAERLTDKYGEVMRYCRALKAWIVWNKTRWEVDETGVVVRMAKKVVRAIPEELKGATTDTKRDAIRNWAMKSESAGKLGAMITLAETERGISVLPDEFDANQMLLNAQNCVVDLGTGKALPHDRAQLLMKQVNAIYDPSATCPTWLNFLNQILDGNQNLIDFIQKAIGYSLTGQIGEQVMFILHGGGSNGKSTLLELLRHLFADYSLNTPTSTIMRRADSSSTTNNDVARLRGARLVTAVETEENQQLAESTIKQITGGDTITARFLFGEFFEFKPTFKLWLAANHKPQIAGGDHGIWRRIWLIPFNVKITDEMKDIHLPEKLKEEAAGILTWAVQGCLKWQAEGLGMPAEIKEAVAEYQAEMDVLAAFLDDTCVQLPTAHCSAAALYKSYQKWTAENGITAGMSQRKLGGKLKDRGFEAVKSTGGLYVWRGIGLREVEQVN